MITPDLQTKLNALVDDAAAEVARAQDAYRAIHGRYWQGARTHAAVPSDGVAVAPDLTRKPTDEAASWSSMGIELPAQTEAALSVDVYETRSGRGYVVNADVMLEGIYYRRAVNGGPDAWREHDWKPFKRTEI
jgi:hypothetical protein